MKNSFWKEYGLIVLLAAAAVIVAVLVFGRSVRSELPSARVENVDSAR